MMNQDEIIEMARQAGFTVGVLGHTFPKLEVFAKLVAEAAASKERERIKEENQRCYVDRGEA
jgi:O-acetylhomoserine/O-acetylserine sulfhydrylase-like pyridoxal-dependent enzyme